MNGDKQRHYFELRRPLDDVVYCFDLTERADGIKGYKRRDKDLWIVFDPAFGWIAEPANEGDVIAGLPWGVLSHLQGDYPPEGDWVSKKRDKSYVYSLVYPEA